MKYIPDQLVNQNYHNLGIAYSPSIFVLSIILSYNKFPQSRILILRIISIAIWK